MEELFVNNNGELLPNKGATLEAGNRGHLYGDGLFETIRLIDGAPINLDIHILRLKEGMSALKMRIPNFFTSAFFSERIKELAKHSKIEGGGRAGRLWDGQRGGPNGPKTGKVTNLIE